MKIKMKITEIKKRRAENLKIKMKINNSHPFSNSKSNVWEVLWNKIKRKKRKNQKRRKRKNKRNDSFLRRDWISYKICFMRN